MKEKYRLVPDHLGTYTLERLRLGMYLTEVLYVRDEKHAKQIIENLERPTIEINVKI